MIYTIIVNDRSYDLPKKTIALTEQMDKISRIDSQKGQSLRGKYKTLFEFVEKLVGPDNAMEIFGSDDLSEVDLSDVTLTFRKIVDSYNKPVHDYEMEQSMEAINGLPIDRLLELAKVSAQQNSKPPKA